MSESGTQGPPEAATQVVSDAVSVVWTAPDFDARGTRLTRHECGGKPVLVVNDMTDQHFKGGQRMPKVGPLDKRNVLDRKMQVAFPNYAMRGALEIKQSRKEAAAMRESSGKEAIARSGGGLYLLWVLNQRRGLEASGASADGFDAEEVGTSSATVVEAFDRSIDLLVSRLRQKLLDDPREPALIKTVRGLGYQAGG